MLSGNSHGPPECNQGWVLYVDTEVKCAAFVKQEVSDIRVKTLVYIGNNIWRAIFEIRCALAMCVCVGAIT